MVNYLDVRVGEGVFMKTVGYRVWIVLASLFLCLFLTTGLGTLLQAASPEYPNRTINIIVPFPPGGTTDLGARALAESMEKHLKNPVVVVNKVGGATTVGGYTVASAKPDGYTLGFFPPGASIPEAYAFFQEAPYTSKDLKHICAVVAPLISVAVREDAPWNSFKELIEYAKKNPGLKVGTGGKHTAQHMLVTTLNKMEKTGWVAVPFSGDATNLPALLGGHTSIAMMDYSALKSLVEAKKVRVLAVVTDRRAEFLPNVPTVVELGYPLVYIPLLGLNGPKGLPEEIVEKLDNLAGRICKEQDFQAKMRNIPLQMVYENSAAYEKVDMKYKDNILSFFKEEGLVK
jgi:tripartite-type tricarboxylate transporter receptor subunit TctC